MKVSLPMLAFGLMLVTGFCHAEEQNAVILTPETDSASLAGYVAQLHDPTGEWTFDDVREPARATQFAAASTHPINHGLSAQTWWYRLVLRAAANETRTDWFFSVGIPTLDYVDIYVTRTDGSTETTLAGDLRPASPNLLSNRPFSIPLAIAPGEEVTVHVRVRQTGRHQVLLFVESRTAFLGYLSVDTYVIGAVFGILLVMTVYNFLIFVVIRDRAYAHYVLFILGMLVATAVLHGEARIWANALLPQALPLINATAALLSALVSLPLMLFGREFMQTRIHAPRAHRATTILAVLAASVIVLYPLVGFLATVQLAVVVFMLIVLSLFAISVYLAVRGVRAARLFLGAYFVLILSATVWTLSIFGALPTMIVWFWAPPVAVCLAVTVFSIALADRLNQERRERERLARLKQFFAPQVAEAILEEGGSALLAPKRREVTVLFTDLRGFTAFAAQSEPEDVVRVLREYHETIAVAAEKHHGNIEQFAGDSVMVFFNAPVDLPEHERCAVRMAFELRETFAALCQAWRKRGYELGVGTGIASGYATVGAVGSKGRMGYSCTGTVTNLAARLCAQAQHGQVLVAKIFLGRIESLVSAEDLGERELKGIPKPVPVSNLVQLSPQGSAA